MAFKVKKYKNKWKVEGGYSGGKYVPTVKTTTKAKADQIARARKKLRYMK